MNRQLFFLCLVSIASSAIAAPQQTQETKPLTSKEIKLNPKKETKLKGKVDANLPLPEARQSNSKPSHKEDKLPPTAAEINKGAMDELIPPNSQTINKKMMGLEQKLSSK